METGCRHLRRPLKTCEFLGYRLNHRAKLAWTEKARIRFNARIKKITSRNRRHKVQTVIDELNLYTRGWLNYYKLSSTYKEVRALSVWVRRRVRLYDWTAPDAIASLKNLRSHPAWTEARSQSRTQGGVGPGSQSLPGTRFG